MPPLWAPIQIAFPGRRLPILHTMWGTGVKIIGVSTVKDEPTFGLVVDHMRRQGVDHIIASCEYGDTSLNGLTGITRYFCDEPFDQGHEITHLTRRARLANADWVIPFDADEYWCATDSRLTVRDVLLCTKQDVDVIYAPMYLHITPEEREVGSKPLPKVCFRPNADSTVAWGSHNVTGGHRADIGPLIVRELQYASWFHFLAKIEKARHLHSQPHMKTHEHGSHMWRLVNMDETELKAEWERHLATETVIDPIP